MAPIKTAFRFSFWQLVLVFILIAMITWIWFGQRIDIIDHQIKNLYK